MEHFSSQDWIDFARQAAQPERARSMKQHLDEGCDKCSNNCTLWRNIVEFAQREHSFQPPEFVLRMVKASFAVQKLLALPGGQFEMAQLVFDSARQVAAAGVRGGPASPRQLLYRSGTVCIDMRMQPKPGSEAVVLLGQLMESSQPAHGIGGVPVSLLSEGDTVSRKKTSTDGEFDFGFESLHDLHLIFGMGPHKKLIVPVPADAGLGSAALSE